MCHPLWLNGWINQKQFHISQGYGTLESASQSLFFFLTGYFDTDDLFAAAPIFFLWITIFFQITFLVILDLFVAAIIYRWKDTRRDAEEFSITGFLSELVERCPQAVRHRI